MNAERKPFLQHAGVSRRTAIQASAVDKLGESSSKWLVPWKMQDFDKSNSSG